MNILITGCAGLLGANYSRHCLEQGHTVIGVDDFSGGYKTFLPIHSNFTFYELNLLDQSKLIEIYKKHLPECTYHFAAYAAEGLSPFIRNFNYTNNILCSVNVINCCVNYNSKLVFTSSMAVYGNQAAPFTEQLLPQPIDPYGIAKYAVELDIKQAHEQFGLRYNIIRPHNVLGLYQNIWDRYRNVIGIFIRKAINGVPLLIYGDGEQTRAFSDIKYYMDPLDKLMNFNDSELFNIGADKYYSLNEVAHIVKEVATKHKYNVCIEHGEARHEAKHAHCDHTKAKQYLNFTDQTNLYELTEKMFAWAIKEPNRDLKIMNYEIEKNLYSYWR